MTRVARRRALHGVVVGALLLLLAACDGSTPDADRARDGAPDCGGTVTKASGQRWTCTFADDFDGDRLDPDRWLAQRTDDSGYRIGPECYRGDDNVEVTGGVLRLSVRKEAAPFVCQDNLAGPFWTQHTAASVSTYRRFAQTYGRFEIRAKMPKDAARGIHSALWLFPLAPPAGVQWPASGEIDVAEYFGAYPDRLVPFVHYSPVTPDPAVTNNYCLVERPDRWHRYRVDWTPRSISIYYDDRLCLRDAWGTSVAPLTGRAPFDRDFFVVLTQGLGAAGTENAFDPLTTPVPATLQVDWVRVWS